MILDNFLFLSGAVSPTGVLSGQAANGAGNIVSTNTVDNGPLTLGGNQAGDQGVGKQISVVFSVLTAPTVGTNVGFQIIQADDAALSVNVEVLNQTDSFAIAKLPAGTLVPLTIDPAAPYAPRRYWGVRYVNVGAIATFSVAAALATTVPAVKNLYYKNGFAVL